jgi:flagellar motility protein MotE (MotC chaperone)
MIGKVLHALGALLLYFCVATVIAGLILTVYFSRAWQLNREKLIQMLAIAQGVDLAALGPKSREDHEEPSSEQVSYRQVLEERAVKTRDLELREQSLHGAVAAAQAQARTLADEKKRLQGLREGFQRELLALEQGAGADGRRDARLTLEALKPKQAKVLLRQMLDQKEVDDVVALLSGMAEGKRAKIIAEFKTDSEAEEIGDVLRRIRQGAPAANIPENTEKKLGP